MGKGRSSSNIERNLKYVKDQKIALLLNEMVVHLLGNKPIDPVISLISYLETKNAHMLAQAMAGGVAAASSSSGKVAETSQAAAAPTEAEKPAVVKSTANWSEKKEREQLSPYEELLVKYPKGTEVDVINYSDDSYNGKRGRVINHHARGNRIGVSFYDSSDSWVFPSDCLRHICDEVTKFPKGTPVHITEGEHIGEKGTVISYSRGRVGIDLSTGIRVGVLPQWISQPEKKPQNFPIGALVELIDCDESGQLGQVLGFNRGRVGVQLSTKVAGVPSTSVRLLGKTSEQMFTIGSRVEIVSKRADQNGLSATVQGHSRGRVGVLIEDGTTAGLLPCNLILVTRTCKHDFPINSEVQIVGSDPHAGMVGFVKYISRGRIGVNLSNDENVGFLPSDVRLVQSKKPTVGCEVQLLPSSGEQLSGLSGRVTGINRGRVGIELESGKHIGVPSDQVKVTGKSAAQLFKPGTAVTIIQGDHNGKIGRVQNTIRGRVGILLEDNSVIGCPPGMIRATQKTAKQSFPVGTEVQIKGDCHSLNGMSARVVGESRGRVGLVLSDGREIGLVPQMLIALRKSAAQEFPVGAEVDIIHEDPKLNGRMGRVQGHNRGRVGIQLLNGDSVGLLPQQLRNTSKSGVQAFPINTEVDIIEGTHNGKHGFVGANSRGRIGVQLDDGEIVGFVAQHLRAVGKSAGQLFSVGAAAEIVCENQELNGRTARVTGTFRGRVGIELENGTVVGVPPQQLRQIGRSADQAYPVGAEVDVISDNHNLNGKHGRVTGTSRGRVGVELDNGDLIGLPPRQLKCLGKTASQAFKIGDKVDLVCENKDLNGRNGKVCGTHRGRIGVELENGTVVGLPPQQLLNLGKSAAQEFKKGAEVDIVCENKELNGKHGRVSGISRGRVGVELNSGTIVGVPPHNLRNLGKSAQQSFPLGAEVDVVCSDKTLNGKHGRVKGVSRGRIGVELSNGESVGLPPQQLRSIGKSADQQVKIGEPIVIISEDQSINGLSGKVTGKNRGRIGVELTNGSIIGLPPQQVRYDGRTATREFKVDQRVVLVDGEHDGKIGNVTGITRGRVGVCLSDGTNIGVPFQMLRSEGKEASQEFQIGNEVTICDPTSQHNGNCGRVSGVTRGRVGVTLSDNSVIGVPSSLLRLNGKIAEQLFNVGDHVTVITESSINGCEGTVTGITRGRVGVKLSDDTHVGIPAQQLRSSGKSAAQTFKVGNEIEILEGQNVGKTGRVSSVNRGRIGVSLLNGSIVGIPAGMARIAELTPEQQFSKGTSVQFINYSQSTNGLIGIVNNYCRGRVIVKTDDDTYSVPPSTIRKNDGDITKLFPIDSKIEIIKTGETGIVKGHSRGRIGIDIDGINRGIVPGCLRLLTDPCEMFPVGINVCVSGDHPQDGNIGEVKGHARGRISIEIDSQVYGIPPSLLRRETKPVSELFPVGTDVQYNKQPAKVTGHSRGRIGIEIGDKKLGVLPSDLN